MYRVLRRPVALAVVALVGVGAGCSGGGSGPSLAPLAGTPTGVRVAQTSFGGTTRTYRVFAPTSPATSGPRALVVVMGGVGDNAQSMTNATEFDQQAAAAGFVVLYAEASRPSWSAGWCCAGPDSDAVDDIGFLDHLVDTVSTPYRVDPTRVMAVGVSAGAMMAYRWACADASRIAGVGSVAGAMILASCHPSRPVSVIEIHGTADPLVPYAGGAVSPEGVATAAAPSSAQLVGQWASLDRCGGSPTTDTQPVVSTTTWSACGSGTAVRLVTIQGGGHTWFAPGYGPTDGAVDATAQIWAFLSTHVRRP